MGFPSPNFSFPYNPAISAMRPLFCLPLLGPSLLVVSFGFLCLPSLSLTARQGHIQRTDCVQLSLSALGSFRCLWLRSPSHLPLSHTLKWSCPQFIHLLKLWGWA